MSHVHNLGGNPNLTAEYEEYLARLAANRRAQGGGQVGKRFEVKTFDSAIESKEESEDDDDSQAESESDRESEDPPAEDHPRFSTKA